MPSVSKMKFFLKTRDHAFTGEEFKLEIDEDLQLLRTIPVPENLEDYYQHEAYISHTDRSNSILEKIYQLVKRIGLRKKVSWLKEFAGRDSRVLDVGAGTGSLVAYLRSKGWKADGIEPISKAREASKRKGVVLHRSLDDIKGEKYEVLTLWHVLEHFRELDEEIDSLLGLIKTNGTLFIALPNFKSYDAREYGEYWAAYDVPRHVWHFSRTAVEKIFAKKGWNVVGTKPMLYDPFYISLLSEGYRGGRFKWLCAFYRGFRSNIHGWRTGEYSSIVYILKKI